MFDELKAVAPNVNLDKLEKQCRKNAPERFKAKTSWRDATASTAFNKRFEVDKFGIVTLKEDPIPPDGNIKF